jgi:methionine biosynthesis protein MetW
VDSRAQIYADGFAQGLPFEDRVTRLLVPAKSLHGRRLLDIGCGDGALTLKLARQVGAADIFGIDISQEACVRARASGVDAISLDIDGTLLPFGSASFDVVYAGEILEHLFDVDTFLDEVRRVLTQEGVAIIDTPNLACWYDRVSLLLGYQPMIDRSHSAFRKRGESFWLPLSLGVGGTSES